MPVQRDYYSILQINPSANQAAIDAAYDRLSRLYDPETSKKHKASERRQDLDEAYDVLSDSKQRSEYDKLRSRGFRPGQTQGDAPRSRNRFIRAGNTLWRWLDSPLVFAGVAGIGVVVILVAIVLISVLDDGGPGAAVSQPSGSPTATPNPTPTLPAQVPTAAPDKPPEITGEEVVTATGLRYVDLTVGTGALPANGDRVAVNYTGWLEADGTKFDSSLERAEAFGFTLGVGGVIKGWDEGVLTMREGGKRRLIIPGGLAYGAAGRPPNIPPDATLVFDIELITVFPAATPTPAPTEPPTATGSTEVSPTP